MLNRYIVLYDIYVLPIDQNKLIPLAIGVYKWHNVPKQIGIGIGIGFGFGCDPILAETDMSVVAYFGRSLLFATHPSDSWQKYPLWPKEPYFVHAKMS